MKIYNYILFFLFLVFTIPVIAQPANDNPCNAVALPVGAACTYTQYTNAGATATAGVPAPGCANYLGGDVWFSAVVPASGTLIFDSNTGVITDGGMAIYTGPCGALTLVGCDDDGSANGLMPSISQTGLTPGTTVFIRFWQYGNNNNGTFSICAKSGVPCTAQGANSSCALADPFCTGVSTDYCNTTNVPSLGGGGIYGCLLSTPNPAFYYVNIATSGPIIFNISQQTPGGVGIDVDFVIWGPFASQAAMCAGITTGNIVSCSYSTAAVETATIPGAVAGQWYMVLITNFSNQPGVINFNQTNTGQPGAGATNCNILTAIPSACAGGTYTISGSVIVPAPPATGTLTITNSCGGSVVLNAPFTSPIPYAIPTPLCGNGLNCNVTAVFSAAGAPIVLPTTYTAPSCPILTAVAGACVGGQYVLSGTLTVGAACLPATGTLTITSSCGGSIVVNAPFTSPYNWSLPASNGNGGNCTITAVFSAAGAPIITPIVIVEPTCCPANAGTITVTQTNGTQTTLANGTTQVVLCPGGSFNFVSNNNYTLPPAYDPGFDDAELFYAIYISPGPTVPDPDLDPNWTGYYWTGQDFTTANGAGYNGNSSGGCSPLLGLPPVGAPYASPNSPINTLVFVPITADDGDNGLNWDGVVNHDQNNDGCFDLGNPISVTFLNPVSFNPLPNCNGTAVVEINGGYPQFFPGLYTLTNTGAGTLSSTSVTSGGNVIITGLTPGQTYSFSVNDGNGCISTFSGVFSGPPIVSIVPASASICVGGCVLLTGNISSGVGNGSLTYSSNHCTQIPDGGISSAAGTPAALGGNWASNSIPVSGVCDPTWETGNPLTICLNILHTYDSDLSIYIQAPNGVFYLLVEDNGVGGDNFTNTCFSAVAATVIPVAAVNAPFSGSYKPEGAGNNFSGLNGAPINGTWTLWVGDQFLADAGTLLNWSITFGNQNTFTYAWSPTIGLSSSTSFNPNACPTTSTTYTLTVTNSCGCTASATSAITVSPPPVINVNTLTICNGQSGVLTATGATTYTWAPSTGLSATTGASVTASPTISTTYTVTGTVSVGCSGTATSVVTVNPQPIVVVPPLIICNGLSGALNASGASTYTWSPSTGLSATTGATVNANPTITTVYTVIGTAVNGCTNSTTVTVTVNPIPSVTSALPSYSICSGPTLATASAATINLFPNPAGATITWTGSDGSSGTGTPISYPIPNNTCADILITYTVTPTFNGCVGTPLIIPLTVRPKPIATFTVAPNPICVGQIAVVTFVGTACPGSTYAWTWPANVTVLSGTGAGPYTVNFAAAATYNISLQITGPVALGACLSPLVTVPVIVNPLPSIGIPFVSICNGQSVIVGANGASSYVWSPSTGLSVTTGASVLVNPTITTTYTIIGTSAVGCTAQTICIVTVNTAPILSTTFVSPPCFGGANGSINLSTVGGTLPFTFLWSNGATSEDLTGLGAGVYTVTVTSTGGCTVTTSVTVTQPTAITNIFAPTNIICNGASTGAIDLTPSGGVGTYTYLWSNGSTTQDLINLVAGTYIVTVTDANGCTKVDGIILTQPVPLVINVSPLTICSGQSGTLTATGASTYTWSPNTAISSTTGTSVSVNPLVTSTYTIIGTNAAGCTGTTTAIVTINPQPIINVPSTTICSGQSGTLTATGASTYTWSPNSGISATTGSTVTVNPLVTSTYTIIGTNATGCTGTTTAVVTVNPQPILNVPPTTICSGQSGTLTAIGASTYTWSPNSGISATTGSTVTVNPIATTTYTVNGTNANGCTNTTSVIVTVNSQPIINVPPVSICNGSSSTLTATGATTYTWSPSTGLSATTGTSVSVNPLVTSTYTIIGTNAAGCTGTTTAVVTIYPLPIITPAHTDATCGNANGTASVSVSSGTPGFSYLWSNGSTLAAIGGLLAGNYSITVTDVNSCTSTVTISINNSGGPTLIPTPVPIACNGGNNGSVSITVSNGTTPFTYLWSNGATTQNISGLTAGSYSVTVTDANNCIATGTTNLTQSLPLLIILSPINVTCNGGINGSVSSTVSGGTPLYSYAWSNGATTTAINTLGSGTYSVTITDGNGCTATNTTTVIDPPTLDVSLLVVDPSCGLNNGSILVDAIVGVAGPYSYLWSNGETGIGITNLGPVSYSVTVTGANGCTGTEIALLVSTLPATATTSQVNVLCNGGATASIDLSVTGWLTFSYNWSNGTTTQDLLNLPVGVYAVTVTASNGCTATANATITQPTAIIPSSTYINTTCGNSNGSIDLIVSGGTPGYNYIWSNGATTQDITTIAAGTYTVTITDANGCTATTSATLTNSANPTANASATAVTCNGGTNGAVTLVVNSGTPPYTFNWSNGALTQNLANLVAGIYTVTVTDVNGCTVTTNATVTQPTAIPPTTTNITICQNQLPYTWNTQILNSAGIYSVTLVNSSGCDSVAILNLTITPLITPVFATPIGPFCQNSAAPVLPLISDNGINGTWNPSSINTASVGTSTYTFTPTVGQCAVPTNIPITILPQIIPTFPPVSPLCFGDPSPILPTTSLEGITGTWSPSTVSNTATGTYVFTPDNPSQCGTTTTITVTVDPLPLTSPIYHD